MSLDARPVSAAAWPTLPMFKKTSREPWAAWSALRAISAVVAFCCPTAAAIAAEIVLISLWYPIHLDGRSDVMGSALKSY